jgi:type I restriction enzyme S subunit
MSEWTETTLGRLATKLVNGGTPPTDVPSYWAGNIPWITGADFTVAGIGEFRRFVSPRAVAETATNVIDKGELLIVTRTGVGKLAIAPCDIAISQDITGFYVDQRQTTPEFLYHRMHQGMQDLKKLNQGTSINGVVRSDLERYPIKLPLLPQQRRIAEILGTVDEAIEQTEALIAKQQQVKAGLMNDLFTRGLTPDGQLRPARAEAPDLYYETRLGWLPKGWDLARLKDKALPWRPHLKTGPFGSSLKGEHWVSEGHPVITIGALGEGELVASELLFVSASTAARLRDYQLSPGDVVFSRVADVGRSAVIEPEHDGWIMSSNLMRISLNPALVAPAYLQAQFSADGRLKAQIRAKVNSGGRDVANGQVLNQLWFAWPQFNEQTLAVERISAAADHHRGLSTQLGKLRNLKQGLMLALLTPPG